MASGTLTNKERKDLETYLAELDKLTAQEPPHIEDTLTPEEYAKVEDFLLYGKGERPGAADRFTVTTVTDPDGTKHKAITDTALEKWNQKCAALTDKYNDVIIKALAIQFNNADIAKSEQFGTVPLLKALLSDGDGNKTNQEELHNQISTLVRYGLMNDKASKRLISATPDLREINGQMSMVWATDEAPQDRQQVPVMIALTYEGEDVTVNKRITADDDEVFTAVCNLIFLQMERGIAAPWVFSVDQIWREMNGIPDSRRTAPVKQFDKICDCLDKMRFTNLYANIKNELSEGYISADNDWISDRVAEGIADENYIIASKRYAKMKNGKRTAEYKFYEMPFMYSYNKAKGRIVLVDYALLDTSDTTRNDGYTGRFRLYLLREIQCMYSGFRSSKKILFDTMYEKTDTPAPEARVNRADSKTEASYKANVNNKAKDDREKVLSILESWKRKKWINDYKPVKKGRKYIGVEIVLNPKNIKKEKALPG